MTKSALTTWWLTGGGILATWLAVNPNTTSTVTSNRVDPPRAGVVREVTLDDLTLQETKLREHAASVALRTSTRNPFRFRKTAAPQTPHHSEAPLAAAAVPVPPQPSLTLSGIATEGQKRTAIISGDGQVYLVKEGESVAGRYRVVSVDSDAATLRDDTGTEIRLVLH